MTEAILKCRVCGTPLEETQTAPHEEGRCARCTVKFASEEEHVWPSREAKLTAVSGVLLGVGLGLWLSGIDPELLSLWGRPVTPTVVFYLLAAGVGAWSFLGAGLRKLWGLVRLRLGLTELGIDSLMSLAILGAIAIGEYVEAAGLAFLFSSAELLERYAVDRSRRSLRELMKLAPTTARVLRDGRDETVPVEQVEVGEVVAVRPGDRIPLDGDVVRGQSAVDQAPITGESVPAEKEPGDPVFAGTINQEGYLEIRVTKHASDTTLAKIIHLIEEAEEQRAPIERFVERFARYYTPTVVLTAVGVAAVPPLAFGAPSVDWFVRALALLVIACPCAMLISTPVSVVSAITAAARQGVLIKGGAYLEEIGQIRAIALDKTGTLTAGDLELTDVVPLGGYSTNDVLRIAAALEARSQHPIAQAIVRRYEEQNGGAPPDHAGPAEFESITGKGVRARLDGRTVLVGKPKLFARVAELERLPQLAQLEAQAKTVVVVGTEGELIGLIAVADRVRPEAPQAVQELKRLGLEVVMITGDNEGTARAVAQKLGIEHYHAEVLPEGKVQEIQKLVEQYGKVGMVGDGVNDAPALATASVGIAMGAAGTDTALETADIALMGDDLTKLPELIELSRRARRVIRQSIGSSIAVKLALGLGVFPGWVTLVVAVLVGDMGMSLAVTGNAMRLANRRGKRVQ
jgi:Cd2+/Zn2+-exporting ATPase